MYLCEYVYGHMYIRMCISTMIKMGLKHTELHKNFTWILTIWVELNFHKHSGSVFIMHSVTVKEKMLFC